MPASRIRPTIALGAILAITVGLGACGGDEQVPEDPAADATTAPDAAGGADESAAAEEPESTLNTPDWAKPSAAPGEKIGAVEMGDVTVDVYQVGTAPASQDGRLLHPDTEEPLIKAGDDLVVVNYVVTNNGDPIDLGMDLIEVSAAYDDWEYVQEMWGIEDDALMEEFGIQWSALDMAKLVDPPVFVLGTGESYSFGTNFKYQPGSQVTFTASYTPVDGAGEPLEDQEVEGTGTATIE